MKIRMYVFLSIVCVGFFIQSDFTFLDKVGKFDRVSSLSVVHDFVLTENIFGFAVLKIFLSFVALSFFLYCLIKDEIFKLFLPIWIANGTMELFTLVLVASSVIGVLQQVAGRPIDYLDFEFIFSKAHLSIWQKVIPSLLGMFVYYFLIIMVYRNVKTDNNAMWPKP